MKVKIYNLGVVTEVLDCADIDEIVNPCCLDNVIINPCYFDDVVQIKMRDHTTKLADSVVFMLEGEE
jgi:hypothetical protein